MGFASKADVDAAWAAGKGQFSPYFKAQASTSVTAVLHSLWKTPGFPGSGTTGTKGKANGRILTGRQSGNTPGGLFLLNAPSGQDIIFAGLSVYPSGAGWGGSVYLTDRVADCNVDANESTGAVVGLDGTSRCESTNDGLQIALTVTSAFSAATNNFTLGYTNDQGVSGRVTPAFSLVASAIVDRSPLAPGTIYLPLQAGDRSARSVEAINNLTGNAMTGAFDIALVREYDKVQLTATTSQVIEHDTFADQTIPVRIFNNSCLSFYVIPNGGNSFTFGGMVKTVTG